MSNCIPLFWTLFFLVYICFCNEGCIESERVALLEFKKGLTDPSNRLFDWVPNSSDCCNWSGIVCHNLTSHVLQLHLRTLSPDEYFGPAFTVVSYSEYEEYRRKSYLGGKVSASLLQLKHLSYLDLSFNDFGGFTIPEFIGSMRSLRFLNLSNAGFGGIVPPQLGNLSNLNYLNLNSYYTFNLEVENLDWVTGLSYLEFLDLGSIDLSRSFDWLKAMNSLPSLVELHLSWCSLPSFSSSSLVNLNFSSLEVLDLSYNEFGGPIPNVLQNMSSSLRELHLSVNYFSSSIPNWLYHLTHLHLLDLGYNQLQGRVSNGIGNLTSLVTLDLSYNFDHEFENGIPNSFQNLCNLRSLSLDYVKLDQEINDVLAILSSIPSLVELHLSYCSLSSFSSSSLVNLNFSSLEVLDLSHNDFGGPIPNVLQNMSSSLRELHLSFNRFNSSIPSWLYDLTHLHVLNLGYNQLQGQVSNGIGNLTSLVKLDLSSNFDLEFENGIPNSFQRFCNLRSLSLSGLKLRQEINDVLAILSSCSSSVLQFLKLPNCQLSGHLTDELAHFKNLIDFDISDNSISGPIPVSFGNLNKLEHVYIYYNNLEGEVSQLHFANLTRLVSFGASGMKSKNMALRVSSNWIPPLQLQTLDLGSWDIGSQFPKWLRPLKHLTYLDLSNCEISSSVPIWFWNSLHNYDYLNFSHNQMQGHISFENGRSQLIDLSSNNFSGTVPCFSSNISALDLSHNSFSRSIFDFLCNKMNEEKEMQILNLEGNHLDGEIPNCWGSWRNLVAIKLSNNSFSGNIPNSIGTLTNLESLHLHNNNLSGEVPSSIKNFTKLFLLDVSDNNLIGNIPTWIGDSLPGLRILNLRANNFDGNLPKELCHLVSLLILDLSQNNFSGTIPSCFSNFTAMASRDNFGGSLFYNNTGYLFMESALLLMKGKLMEYSTILRFLRSINLSNNKLSGEIPREMTSLTQLVSLNLSHNALTGRIPDKIGDMKGLDALDFSHNRLSGEIPPSMSTMTFLGTLDLSQNNLSGRIPTGTQLQSFNSTSFTGNHLCGLPLTNNCTSNNGQLNPQMEEDDENEDDVDLWFYESMAFGFVFGFWSVVGSLIFIRKWRHFYFHSLYHLKVIIWWNLVGRFN